MKLSTVFSLGLLLVASPAAFAMQQQVENAPARKVKHDVRLDFATNRVLPAAAKLALSTQEAEAFDTFAENWQTMQLDKDSNAGKRHKAFRTALKHAQRALYLVEVVAPAALKKEMSEASAAIVKLSIDKWQRTAEAAFADVVAKFIEAANPEESKELRKAVKKASQAKTAVTHDAAVGAFIQAAFDIGNRN